VNETRLYLFYLDLCTTNLYNFCKIKILVRLTHILESKLENSCINAISDDNSGNIFPRLLDISDLKVRIYVTIQ
jgi:hypothetical protein